MIISAIYKGLVNHEKSYWRERCSFRKRKHSALDRTPGKPRSEATAAELDSRNPDLIGAI